MKTQLNYDQKVHCVYSPLHKTNFYACAQQDLLLNLLSVTGL
jgi:hypothetical protein